jgi:hypothetical protein
MTTHLGVTYSPRWAAALFRVRRNQFVFLADIHIVHGCMNVIVREWGPRRAEVGNGHATCKLECFTRSSTNTIREATSFQQTQEPPRYTCQHAVHGQRSRLPLPDLNSGPIRSIRQSWGPHAQPIHPLHQPDSALLHLLQFQLGVRREPDLVRVHQVRQDGYGLGKREPGAHAAAGASRERHDW